MSLQLQDGKGTRSEQVPISNSLIFGIASAIEMHCNFAREARNDDEGETAMFLADLMTTAMTF